MKKMMVLIALFSPLLAQAEVAKSECISEDGRVKAEIYYHFEGSFEQMAIAGEVEAGAVVKVYRKGVKAKPDVYIMKGMGAYSTKGPYFEMKASDGTELFLSAVASKSPSELVIKDKVHFLYCD